MVHYYNARGKYVSIQKSVSISTRHSWRQRRLLTWGSARLYTTSKSTNSHWDVFSRPNKSTLTASKCNQLKTQSFWTMSAAATWWWTATNKPSSTSISAIKSSISRSAGSIKGRWLSSKTSPKTKRPSSNKCPPSRPCGRPTCKRGQLWVELSPLKK